MKQIMVSILVPTYGHEKYIGEALDSILMQKTKYSYEVIVGEDASPDHTRAILKKYEKEHPDIFTMIYRDINCGGCSNYIDLIHRASGKYIITLEGDDFWISEDKLECQVTYLEQHPEYTAVAHNCLIVDQNSMPTGKEYPECKDTEYTLRHFRRNILPGQTTSIMYRATLYRQIASDKIWKTQPLAGDQFYVLGTIARGPIHCIQKKMSAYRYITSNGTSYSATVSHDFNDMVNGYKKMIAFSRRLNNRKAEIATEGRYFAIIFFDGLMNRQITLRQAFRLYQYTKHKFVILIIKPTDMIFRKASIIMSKIKNAIHRYHEWKYYISVYKRCRPLHKYMLDAESKKILHLREKFISHPDIETFINGIAKANVEFTISELEPYISSTGKIIICMIARDFAAVKRLHYTQNLLKHSIWRDRFECVWLSKIFDVHAEDIIVPVWGTQELDTTIFNQKFKGMQLHIPLYAEVLVGTIGKQYFDVLQPCQNETIVDCGAYDGLTELQIAEWTNYNYKKIYAFEPNQTNCQKCLAFYKKNALANISLIQKGSWSKNEMASFSVEQDMSPSGKITNDGTEKILLTTIDNVVGNNKVTLIKMDVEGAELESLKGAAKTIQRDTPKLAICIYHKPEDLWIIPEYILKLNNHYKFYIRHYTSYTYETVLYALVK